MIKHFERLPDIHYPLFSPASVYLLNQISQRPMSFKIKNKDISVRATVQPLTMGDALFVRFKIGAHHCVLRFNQAFINDYIDQCHAVKQWPMALLHIRVQHVLEPVMCLLEDYLQQVITIEEMDFDTTYTLDENAIALEFDMDSRVYPLALNADIALLNDITDAIKKDNQSHKIITNSTIKLDVSVSAKLSVGNTVLSYGDIKNLNINDIILVLNHSVNSDSYQLLCAQQRLEAHFMDNKRFSIIKKIDEVSMTQSLEASLINTSEIEVNVDFICGNKKIALSDIEKINPGYVFELNQDISSLVSIEVSGKKIGEGRLVEVDNRLGVQVVTLATASNHANDTVGEDATEYESEPVAVCE